MRGGREEWEDAESRNVGLEVAEVKGEEREGDGNSEIERGSGVQYERVGFDCLAYFPSSLSASLNRISAGYQDVTRFVAYVER